MAFTFRLGLTDADVENGMGVGAAATGGRNIFGDIFPGEAEKNHKRNLLNFHFLHQLEEMAAVGRNCANTKFEFFVWQQWSF
jgi:hypothetical protein